MATEAGQAMSKPAEPEHTSSFEYKYLYEKYQSAIEELKAAKEALHFYHRTGTWENYGTNALEDSGCVASQALARIDKFLKENE